MIEFLGVSVYLLIALVNFLLLIVIMFLGADWGFDADADMGGIDADGGSGIEHFQGGHGDFSGAHLSPLSLPLVLAFFACFGGFGALFEALDYNQLVTPLYSAVLAFLISGVLYFGMDRLFVRTQASSSIRYDQLVGKEGVVTIPISNGAQGQILVLTQARGRTLMTAVSSEDLSVESPIVIEGFSGSSVVVRKKKL